MRSSQCLMTDEPDNQNQMNSVSKKKRQQIRVSKVWQKGNVSSPFTSGYKANQASVPSTPPTLIYCNFYQLHLNYTTYLGFLSYFLQSHTGLIFKQQPFIFHLRKDSPCLPSILTLVQTRKHFYSQGNTPSWHKQKRYNETKRTEGKMQQHGGQEKLKVT